VSETTSLKDALTAAEAELDTIAAQAKEAHRQWCALDAQQMAKVIDEIRELRWQIREEEQR